MANVWEQLICQTCGSNVVEIVDGLLCCKACKSKHTLQEKISEEEVIALNRAASYRNRLAFDDAFDEYTELLKKHPDNEAANWGAFLSFYGIVYEKDTDGRYIPTCHRLSEKPVESSPYYYHFGAQHKTQAEEIEKLRVAIMDKAKKIQPYDVFICYKATEERFGMPMPTKEAAWARDVYDMLTHELKLRVFFAEKSLQGSNIEYEPHIYSALNSAKLMLVLTTGIENVNANWVKNEWKRFSHYIKEGQDKTIRVVYEGIQPYDLPQELQKTQAIDHNAMGWDKAVKQAAESIFAVKEEKPEWQKAMEEMQAKMNELQARKKVATTGSVSMAVKNPDFVIVNGTLMEYTGKAKVVVIPDGIIGIGERAFKGLESVTSVIIPDSVTSIGEYVFSECYGLTNVTIGNGVISIGEHAFDGCGGLTNIKIPDSVTSIGNYAFFACWGLTSIEFPNSVKNIGNNTVSYCDSLANVRIGNGVTSIESYAFCDCGNLTSIQFNGTKAQWDKILKGEGWKNGVPATEVVCSDGTVAI